MLILVGHFVLSPREREKRDENIVEEMKGRDRGERGTGMKVRNRRNKNPPLPLPATRIVALANCQANISWTARWFKIQDTFATPDDPLQYIVWGSFLSLKWVRDCLQNTSMNVAGTWLDVSYWFCLDSNMWCPPTGYNIYFFCLFPIFLEAREITQFFNTLVKKSILATSLCCGLHINLFVMITKASQVNWKLFLGCFW